MKRESLDALSGAVVATLVAAAALAAMSGSSSASAQVPVSASGASRPSEFGDATHAWLELQRSNRAAAPALPTLGVEAGLAYERYLNSFKTKIPDTLSSAIEGGSDARNGMGAGNQSLGGAAPASAY